MAGKQFLFIRFIPTSLFLLCPLICAAIGFAQGDSSAQIQPLTIQQAVSEAVEKNLNVLAEKYSIPIAEARIISARLRPNPILTVGGDHLDLLGTGYVKENNAAPLMCSPLVSFYCQETIHGFISKKIPIAAKLFCNSSICCSTINDFWQNASCRAYDNLQPAH
jgi:hypothetical protein